MTWVSTIPPATCVEQRQYGDPGPPADREWSAVLTRRGDLPGHNVRGTVGTGFYPAPYYRCAAAATAGQSADPALRQMLVGTFQDDFTLTGDKTTWTSSGSTLPCPVVVLTPQATWASQKANLNNPKNGVNAGRELAVPANVAIDPEQPRLTSDPSTLESWRATRYPRFGTSPSPTGSFVAPLAGVTAEYNPPMPQGPTNISDMIPGACVPINQTDGSQGGPCSPS